MNIFSRICKCNKLTGLTLTLEILKTLVIMKKFTNFF